MTSSSAVLVRHHDASTELVTASTARTPPRPARRRAVQNAERQPRGHAAVLHADLDGDD